MGGAQQAEVAVVIPCLNAAAHLGTQLAALARERVDRPWEVVVVDNGSTDDTIDVARAFESRLPRLRIVHEPRRGRHHACNAGAAATDAQSILFVDADDEILSGYVTAMANALDRSPVVAAAMDHERFSSGAAEYGLVQTNGLAEEFGFLPFALGATLGVSSAALREVGGFDGVPFAEDADLSWRLQLAGCELLFVPEARIAYRQREGLGAMFRQHLRYGAAQAALYRRFRAAGMERRASHDVRADWRAGVVGLLASRSRAERARCLRRVGRCIGRLVGSARQHVWYP